MYIPKHFEQTDTEAMHALILQHPFGLLVTTGTDGPSANHMPFELDALQGTYGVLRGHVARANPVWRDITPDCGALAIFTGADAYVSPSWYPTKPLSGKVVPTWNYVVVHAHGRINVIDDLAWKRAHLENLVAREESGFDRPWSMTDAPADYIDRMLGAIVGIEIGIARLEGKWKVSQNRPEVDRVGVVEGLRHQGAPGALRMAEYVAECDR